MKAYSVDLRQRVLAAVDRGMARTEVAATFGVSLATIKRLVALRRTRGELTALHPSGRRRTIPPAQHHALWAQLEADPDATIAMHTERWNATHGTTLSQWTVGRAIRRVGWTRKKRRWVPPSATSSTAPTTDNGLRAAQQPTS
jgi:transposase